jgi:hypothetical protein
MFRAEPEEKGRTEHIAETYDATYRVDRQLQQFLLLAFNDDRLTLFVDVGTLRTDIECVEEFSHPHLLL